MVNRLLFNTFIMIALVAGCLSNVVINADDKNSKKATSYRGKILEMTGDDTVPVKVWNALGKPVLDPYYAFDKKGLVLVGKDYSLRLDGGRFFSAGAEEYLGGCLKNSSGELTISIYINPAKMNQKGKGCIVGYGPSKGDFYFSLMQEKDALVFTSNKSSKNIQLLKLKDDKPFHLVFTVSSQKVIIYQNSKKVGSQPGIKSDFSKWENGQLFFGNNAAGTYPWNGRLERFSLFNKALISDEVVKVANASLKEIKEIGTSPTITFEGTLLERSKYPMPWKEGFTYREVLTVCEYMINKVIKGNFKKKKIRVAEWAYVDRIFLKNIRKKIGSVQTLMVEDFNDNPQLATLERADTLELDIDAVTYYDLSPLVALPKNEYPKPPKKENK